MSDLEAKSTFSARDALVLIAILLIGLWVRLDNLLIWQDFSDAAFIEGQPLLTNFDGYYYLRLARDIVENTYAAHDVYRAVPDYAFNSSPPPLLSLVLAKLSVHLPFSLDWIAVVLPAVLGSLIAAPLFGLGWLYGGRICAYTAAIFGVLSSSHIFRTQLGWFDTDCLNVVFPFGITLCIFAFATCGEKKRYIYLLLAALLYVVFYFWWDQAKQVVTFFTIVPLTIALIFFYRPPLVERFIFYLMFFILALAILYFMGWEYVIEVWSRIISLFRYISKEDGGYFPNIGMTVAEQSPAGFSEAIASTSDSVVVFLFSILGLAIMCWISPARSLFVAPYIILGSCAVLFANRFLIFLSPVLALGIGMFFSQLWQANRMRLLLRGSVVTLTLIMIPGSIYREYVDGFLPQMRPELIAGMKEIERITPENSVAWAWWNYGYAINYHAQRATINDGSVHSGERTVYTAFPLAVSNYRLAANFMRFYAEQGVTGLDSWYRAVGGAAQGYQLAQNILENGPDSCEEIVRGVHFVSGKINGTDQWCSFFFPDNSRPIYLFINDYLRMSKIWFWQGTWDIEHHKGILIRENEKDEAEKKKNDRIPKNMVRSDLSQEEAVRKFEESVFSKLFMQKSIGNGYFIPISIDKQAYQIWEVRGERRR